MLINSLWSPDRSYQLLSIAVGLAIPILTILGWRGWARYVRRNLPPWRNFLGAISMCLILLNWLAFVTPALLESMGFGSQFASSGWFNAMLLVALIGLVLPLALKGVSRIQTFVAGLLMVGLWFTSIVH